MAGLQPSSIATARQPSLGLGLPAVARPKVEQAEVERRLVRKGGIRTPHSASASPQAGNAISGASRTPRAVLAPASSLLRLEWESSPWQCAPSIHVRPLEVASLQS